MKMTLPTIFLRHVLSPIALLTAFGMTTAGATTQPSSDDDPDHIVQSVSPDWAGIKQFGTKKHERGYVSVLDKRGNLYVTGYTGGDLDGDGPGINFGSFDTFVMKLDPQGEIVWPRRSSTMECARSGPVEPTCRAVWPSASYRLWGACVSSIHQENSGALPPRRSPW